jgi:hypothetical protein
VAATPKAIVEQYFRCMRAGDLGVLELFREDAVIQGLGFRKQGRDEIADFYGAIIAGARPSPSPAGPLLCGGERVVAEIDIGLADGTIVHALDVFVVRDGRIFSLTYYTADYPADTGSTR